MQNNKFYKTRNLRTITELSSFMGGDNEDVPVCSKVIVDMKMLVDLCDQNNIPQPEIFPWSGGDGVQAEWEYDWYLEIDSSSKGIEVFACKGNEYMIVPLHVL